MLTGLIGGLLAQKIAAQNITTPNIMTQDNRWDLALDAALAGVWWHSHAAREVAAQHTVLGVDASRLATTLLDTLGNRLMSLGDA